MSEKVEKTKEPKEVSIIEQHELPAVFSDTIRVSRRRDGMCLIQFAVALPNSCVEQTRVMLPDHAAKGLVDILCDKLDHFPSKAEVVDL